MFDCFTAKQKLYIDVWTPESLFKICLDYVGKNINLVESLVDFPEVVGEQILQTCIHCGYFTDNNATSEHIISLFVAAYGQEFMQSFQCQSLQLVNEFCECLVLLCLPVTHLDLHGCLLGNNNDILRGIVDMENLRVLNLSCNELSDDGFRLLLARFKMYKRGFQALESLDVADNIVSIKTLKSLLTIPKLRKLRISVSSSFKMGNSQFVQEWTSCLKHDNFEILPVGSKVANNIKTEGWGAAIVYIWENQVAEWERARLAKIAKRCQSFYAIGLKKVKVAPCQPSIGCQTFETYTYVKRDNKTPALDANYQASGSRKNLGYTLGEGKATKRKQDNEDEPNAVSNLGTKQQKMDDDRDMELLRIYLKP